jgi:hypothetical protein
LLHDGEGHIHFIETELELMDRIGEQNMAVSRLVLQTKPNEIRQFYKSCRKK